MNGSWYHIPQCHTVSLSPPSSWYPTSLTRSCVVLSKSDEKQFISSKIYKIASETDSSRIAKPNHELIYRTAKILGNHEPLSRVIRPSIFNHWLTVPTKNLNEIQREKKIAGEPLDVVLKYRDHLKLRHASDWFMKKAKENREKSPAYQRIKWNP